MQNRNEYASILFSWVHRLIGKPTVSKTVTTGSIPVGPAIEFYAYKTYLHRRIERHCFV